MKKNILILGAVCALFSTTLFGANSVLKELDLDLESLYNESANQKDQNASKLELNSTKASRAADITAALKDKQSSRAAEQKTAKNIEQNASAEQNLTAQITPDERLKSKIRMLIMSDFDKSSKAGIVLVNDANASASAKASGFKVVFESSASNAGLLLSKSDLVLVNAGLDTAFAAASLRINNSAGLPTAFKLDFSSDTKKFRRLLDTYRGAVAARSVRIFMLGSGEIKSMDESTPASLSSHAIGGLIRAKLHFGGLIISADLSKISGYSTEQKVNAFLGAGGDIMYFSDSAEASRAADILLKATQNGSISNARINKSFERVSEVFNIKESKSNLSF
ncbi:glycoside hydrolase family 3 N-terminal domain-containing protein [Campylobacter sp.]|uniref:glycoside hydrolase family 3 N-terminal domain-containing protein n=1 Tax=Campylobacter sp. TaxID=205 RepID=UPI002A5EEB60|nr:glycoside hydrolase family 3 N-terminal domain-containing protein [Campylobacter sp.]MDD7703848.1 glycoside hydrolase family 3 N-terminal domain-containing protein [Campylobacteraceae bacterium]MDY2636129.1 glycoside hydrolase family 3 N-terminal domain-containing protein [Campylobacter sp.]